MAKGTKEEKKGRGEYSIADVAQVLRDGTPLELYQVTRYFPALVNAMLVDPLGAFVASFGTKRADGAEYRVRDAIGAMKKDGEGPAEEDEDLAVDIAEPAPAGKPAPKAEKEKPSKKPKAKSEDDVDALLNQLDDAVGEEEEDGDEEEGD